MIFTLLLKIVIDVFVFVGNAALIVPKVLISIVFHFIKLCLSVAKLPVKLVIKISDFFKKRAPTNLSAPKPASKKKKRNQKETFKIPVGIWLKIFSYGVCFSFLIVFVPSVVFSWYRDLPSPQLLDQAVTRCTEILDRKMRLMYQICPDKRSQPVGLEKISPKLIDATLAIEDSAFYSHIGIRPLSMLRAFKANLDGEIVQGGSTITQQLVKMSLLSPERTYTRKIKELVLALMVERKYSKDQILQMYLNNAPYGGNIVGVETASEKFFGKKASELNLAEASMLAGLPTAPSIYSPFTSFELAKERQQQVLERMVMLGYIKPEEKDIAYAEELTFIAQEDFIRAPHFVDFVRAELESQYGKRYVDFGGLTVVTSLDLDVQAYVQQIVREEVDKIKYLNATNGAAVVMNAKTGEILAMVGSRDYFDTKNGGAFNVASSYNRQPGSTIKVVTYSLALSRGFKTTSVIDDSPISIKSGTEVYTPVNYDGKYHGKVTLRAALANSYNIPAVNVLRQLNLDDMVNLGRDMGLTNWRADGNYGLSITLGGKETRLVDLTNVYGTLARGGVYKPIKPFIKITDSLGYDIYKGDTIEKRVLSDGVAYIMTNILSDYYARLPAFGTRNFLSIPGHVVAVKTGTTDLKRDNYTVGYTPTYVVGVWVGNNNNSPMSQFLASGLTGAAPIWNRVMTSLLNDTPNEQFKIPDSITVKTFTDCGNVKEVYIKGTEPTKVFCQSKESEKSKDKKKSD